MLQKLARHTLKPLKYFVHNKAYREYLKLYDKLNKTTSFPVDVSAMEYQWQVHHAQSFLNQFESIFVNHIYRFKNTTIAPIIIDCGANMGTSVLYFKKYYPQSQIHCFEPDSDIFKVLQCNVSRNQLSTVNLYHKAVWTQEESLFFEKDGAQSGKISVQPHEAKVSCIRLLEFMRNFEVIDFLKLDIEGAELPVLLDIQDELYKVKNLFVEYHSYKNKKQQLSVLLHLLEQKGFRYFIGGHYNHSPLAEQQHEQGMDLTLDIFAQAAL